MCFLYMSEIMNYKGVSVATALHWLFLIITGLTVKPMFENEIIGDYVFMIFGVFTLIAVVSMSIFMKETKGLTEA
jgi:hypothetical protein